MEKGIQAKIQNTKIVVFGYHPMKKLGYVGRDFLLFQTFFLIETYKGFDFLCYFSGNKALKTLKKTVRVGAIM